MFVRGSIFPSVLIRCGIAVVYLPGSGKDMSLIFRSRSLESHGITNLTKSIYIVDRDALGHIHKQIHKKRLNMPTNQSLTLVCQLDESTRLIHVIINLA